SKGVRVSNGIIPITVHNIGSLGVTAATNDAFYLPVKKPLELEDETKGVGCTPHLIPGKYIQHFSISSTSGSLRWFRDNFAYEEMEKGEETNTSAYVYMDELATNVPLGSEGLFFYPYLWGADVPIFNEDACGMFFGIKLGHSKGHFIRAILEGVAFQYIGAFDFLRKFDVDVNTVSMAGGASTSNLWNQLKADAINMPIQIPSSTDAAPFGAALAAGVAVGEFKSLDNAASRLIKWESTFESSTERHEKMRKLYKKYMEIYDVISPHMRASTENK
ncbi:MAG: FGGY-family carbohydrate kinase, partial [Promethearchaeia archaeon]